MRKFSIFCLAASVAIASAVTVSSVISDSNISNSTVVIEARPAAPFIELQHAQNGKGQALIGIEHYDVQLSFEYEDVLYRDRITGERFAETKVLTLDDVVVTDLNGKQVYDFTDHVDHQQFVDMIETKLVEHEHAK